MLLLYQIAMALFIGLGPLFILCLLFDQTKSLFQRWLLYGLGTMFSMAVLAAMVGIALRMVINVAIAFWTRQGIETLFMDGSTSDMTSQALQQGGMGLILTTLILTAPPMAAMFFQGTLGSFMAYSQIGGAVGAQPGPQGQSPGSYMSPQSDTSSSAAP
jgi:type IV secretion system protein VirB6